jgi:ABC-2 type transport system ATP-binding protein
LAESEHAVEARGLVKRYGDHVAVAGIDLTIARGTIYGILGPNGAGKSTTIRMILGVVEPDDGYRTVLGHDAPRDVVTRVGFLPEERSLYKHMKARESIAFMGALRGLPWKEGRTRADRMLERFGLGDAGGRRIEKLSKGQAQLVQLIAAIVHAPDLIVLDEPFSGLDPVNQQTMEDIVLAERDRGATIIFSTHVMSHAERMCDRIAVIAGGLVRFEGTVDEARSLLPQQVRWTPSRNAESATGMLPADARLVGPEWRFSAEGTSVEETLRVIGASGLGVRGLAIERPSLHDAFVAIVGERTQEATA